MVAVVPLLSCLQCFFVCLNVCAVLQWSLNLRLLPWVHRMKRGPGVSPQGLLAALIWLFLGAKVNCFSIFLIQCFDPRMLQTSSSSIACINLQLFPSCPISACWHWKLSLDETQTTAPAHVPSPSHSGGSTSSPRLACLPTK